MPPGLPHLQGTHNLLLEILNVKPPPLDEAKTDLWPFIIADGV